jgi:hypothetical protein
MTDSRPADAPNFMAESTPNSEAALPLRTKDDVPPTAPAPAPVPLSNAPDADIAKPAESPSKLTGDQVLTGKQEHCK